MSRTRQLEWLIQENLDQNRFELDRVDQDRISADSKDSPERNHAAFVAVADRLERQIVI